MAETFTIARLGAGGDGIADTPDGPVHIAYALPGETVQAERVDTRAEVVGLDAWSPARVAPFCPYFGRCGGCVAQHMAPDLYEPWKRAKVADALARARVEAPVAPLRNAHGAGRRRITLHARFEGGRVEVGFMAARSHHLVPIERCPVAVEALADAPRIAATLAGELASLGKPLDVSATATEGGLDIDVRGAGPGAQTRRQNLIAIALNEGLARLSVHGDVLIEARPPAIRIGETMVLPPPGGFLQATGAGEEALAALVAEAVGPKARRVADLFAGIGPFALRLAASAEVHAVEADAALLAALDRASREATGLRRITTERRDLFRRPLLPPELDCYNAIVLDPPRAGAEAQIRQVIPSSLEHVVMVSCDPGTFGRDAAALAGAGFTAEQVVPVDQFRWSAHVEIVGSFRRPPARRKRRR